MAAGQLAFQCTNTAISNQFIFEIGLCEYSNQLPQLLGQLISYMVLDKTKHAIFHFSKRSTEPCGEPS